MILYCFTQQYGIDLIETFSPTLKQDSLRLITAIFVQLDFSVNQIDIYMTVPEGHPSRNKHYWRLKKGIMALNRQVKDGITS